MEDTIALVNTICERSARLCRVLSVLECEFGGATKPRQRRAKVVGEIVQRFAQNAHVCGVFIEESIELADEDGQLTAAVGRPDSRGEVAGFENPARCIGDFAQRTRRAPCEERAGGHRKKKHDGTYCASAPQRREQHGAAVRAAANLDQASVERVREAIA